jgi:hypothetical protein
MSKKESPKGTIFRYRSYLEVLADRIFDTRPTRREIYNTLFGVFQKGATEGWQLRLEQSVKFKAKREEHRVRSFNMVKDHIDSLIHEPIPPQA